MTETSWNPETTRKKVNEFDYPKMKTLSDKRWRIAREKIFAVPKKC